MKRILLVDDEKDVLRVTSFRIKKAGYEVLVAKNGQEALDSARSLAPDLILLDLRLPIIGGSDVCKQLKSDDKTKHIKIILFTASTGHLDDIVKESNADDFISKPFNIEELSSKISKLIG